MDKKIPTGFGRCPKLPWMVEFHSTADGKIPNHQLTAAFADNHLQHLASLQEKSRTGRKRLTQLIAIMTPNINDKEIDGLLMAGMTVAVIRMAYFNPPDARLLITRLKARLEDFGKKIGRVFPLALALDVTEPEIVTGKLLGSAEDVILKKGAKTKVTTNPDFANKVNQQYIYVNYDNITNVLQPGDSLILGDGEISLSALKIARDIVECIVEKAGRLADNLSVKLPNTPVTIPSAESQEKFLQLGMEIATDMVFVGPTSLKLAKEILGPTVLVVLKVESGGMIDDFDKIVEDADAVLVDGEKLMITAQENVFILQKCLLAKCNKLSKPVIVAINCNNLTKPLVFDVANAVIDGADALLLPPDNDLMESVSLICKSAEAAIYQKRLFEDLVALQKPPIEPIYSLCISAVEASFNSNAAAIILLTTSGRTAKLLAMYRPRCPIIALTRFGRIAKQLMVYKGVIPIFYAKSKEGNEDRSIEDNMQLGMTFGKLNGYIRMGDAVVIVFGTRCGVGFKNCMEVVFASEYDTIPVEE